MISGRFSGRVEWDAANMPLTGGFQINNDNGSVGHPDRPLAARRISPQRLRLLELELTARDRRIIDLLHRLRVASMPQLVRLFFTKGNPASDARLARHALKRLVDRRILHRLDRRIGGSRAGSTGHVYALDVAGQALAGSDALVGRRRRPYEPGQHYLAHSLAVTELYVRLIEAERDGQLEIIDFEAEPACWRSFFGPSGARQRLKPDCFIRVAATGSNVETLWFCEIDRGSVSIAGLQSQFRAYRQYWSSGREQSRWDDVFPAVLWLTPNSARLRKVIDVAASQPPDSWPLFSVRLFDDVIESFIRREDS